MDTDRPNVEYGRSKSRGMAGLWVASAAIAGGIAGTILAMSCYIIPQVITPPADMEVNPQRSQTTKADLVVVATAGTFGFVAGAWGAIRIRVSRRNQ